MGYVYGEKSEPQYTTLTGEGNIGIDGHTEYTWKNIYRSDEFMKTTELTGAAKEEVEKSEFVLVFLKTAFTEQDKWSFMQGDYKVIDGVKVADVSILRLMFEADGVCYNLGALMDKQEGDDVAGNKPESNNDILATIINFFKNLWNTIKDFFGNLSWWQWLLIGLAAILGVGIIVSLIMFGIKAVIKVIAKLIWQLLCLPFKALSAIFKGNGKK